jgi:putative redox protein
MPRMAKPPVEVALRWTRDLVFDTTIASGPGPVIDSDGIAGASPVQALALALGSCMGVDVVMILQKGRHDVRGLTVNVTGTRADGPPSFFTGFSIEYVVSGPVPEPAACRAIELSREKYCSVWHSLRRDTPLDVRITRIDG